MNFDIESWQDNFSKITHFYQCVRLVAIEAQTPISAHLGTQRRGFSSVYSSIPWGELEPSIFLLLHVFLLSTTFAGIAQH